MHQLSRLHSGSSLVSSVCYWISMIASFEVRDQIVAFEVSVSNFQPLILREEQMRGSATGYHLSGYGGSVMHKLFVGSIILVLCAFGWSTSCFGQEVSAPRGELRIVDKNPANWASVVFNVFDHLIELNTDGTLVPRLATGWQWHDDRTLEVTLRQGVIFHNGEVFDAEIVKL